MVGWLSAWVGGWSDTDNKANLSPASLRYAANEAVAELGKIKAYPIIYLKRPFISGQLVINVDMTLKVVHPIDCIFYLSAVKSL